MQSMFYKPLLTD